VHGFEVVEAWRKSTRAFCRRRKHSRRTGEPCAYGHPVYRAHGDRQDIRAEAFAKECRLTTIKLKNFRSKWVGATEGNLEKILGVIQAIGQVVVIIDEGDRAFGGTDGEGDGGTSSRVIARIKEFMSDTSNRGRILFLLMTNRPDKLDSDIKRAGRLDRKIPFLYSQTAVEVEAVLGAQLRKNSNQVGRGFHIDASRDLPKARGVQQCRRRGSLCSWPTTSRRTIRAQTRPWKFDTF